MKKFDINVDPEKDEYVITLRFKCNVNRYDYDGEPSNNTYSQITGVINQGDGSFGFAHTIDMEYKGKPDQYTSNIVSLEQIIDEEDFIKTCEDWSIPVVIE